MPPWSVLILHDFRIQAWPNSLVKLLVPVPMAASGLHLLSHFDDIVRLSSLTVGISAANTGSHQVSHLREAVHDGPIGNTWRCGSERGFQSIPGWWSLGWIQDNTKTCKDVQRRAQSELHPSCRQEPDGFASFSSELWQLESTHCGFECNAWKRHI